MVQLQMKLLSFDTIWARGLLEGSDVPRSYGLVDVGRAKDDLHAEKCSEFG